MTKRSTTPSSNEQTSPSPPGKKSCISHQSLTSSGTIQTEAKGIEFPAKTQEVPVESPPLPNWSLGSPPHLHHSSYLQRQSDFAPATSLSESEEALDAESEDEESDALSLDSSASMSSSTTALAQQAQLKRHLIYIDDEASRKTGESIIAKAMDVLAERRGSDFSEEKRGEIKEAMKKSESEYENTFVVNFTLLLLGEKKRMVPKDAILSEAELDEKRNWISRAWSKEHLYTRWNQDFAPNSLPPVFTGNEYLDKMTKDEEPGLKQPKPDIVWGLSEDAFTQGQRTILHHEKNELAGHGMYSIFCVLEAKSINSPIWEAVNQCARSGAAMVFCQRRLYAAATATAPKSVAPAHTANSPPALGPSASNQPTRPSETTPAPSAFTPSATTPSPPKPDSHSFVFTIATDPHTAIIFVNWALVENPDQADQGQEAIVKWQQHELKRYDLQNTDQINEFNHDKNNVLEWGVGPRKRRNRELCDQILRTQPKGKGTPSSSKKRKSAMSPGGAQASKGKDP